jgi:hypothetical protein
MQRDFLMKARLALILSTLTFCLVAPCASAHAQRLYPVQGPATAETPPQEFTAKLSNIGSKNGKITLSRADGQSFQGTWTMITATFVNPIATGTPASYPPQPNLAFAWDIVYGQGYFVAHILGSQTLGQAMLKGSSSGNEGTVIQFEFQKEKLGMPIDNIFGVAVDNQGNIYKVVL